MRKNSIFLIGPMGAGKTAVAKRLATLLGLTRWDSDEVIAERAGVSIEWIFEQEGEAGFRKREMRVIDELTRLPNIVLATGGGCVTQESNRLCLQERGFVVYLQVSPDVQWERTCRRRDHRPLLQVYDSPEKLAALTASRASWYEAIAHYICNTDHQSVQIIVEQIYQHFIALKKEEASS